MLDRDFIFNGKSNRDFGAICCYFDKGVESSFAAVGKTKLTTESTYNNSKYQIISNNYEEVLSFKVCLIHEKNQEFTLEECREIIKWLCGPLDYKVLKLDDELHYGLNYFVKFTEPTHRFFNGFNGLEFTATCQYPYALTDKIIKKFTTARFTINNKTDEPDYLYPELVEIKNTNDSSTLTITNINDIEHSECVFTDLKRDEVIKMYCMDRILESSDSSVVPITKFNKNWIRMIEGKNTFTVSDSAEIKFVYREVRKVGIA